MKYLQRIIGFLFGFITPVLFAFGAAFLIAMSKGFLFGFNNTWVEWLFFLFIGLSLIASGSVNSFILGLSPKKKKIGFCVLAIQFLPIILYFWIRATEFDSDVGAPDLSQTLPVFGVYLLACLLGAYVGARNPIQQFIQSKDRSLPKY